jgi:predicted dehydrogenase
LTFTFAILGAGGRGNYFSQLIERNPRAGNVVAVADPDPARRKLIADRHECRAPVVGATHASPT